MVDLNEPLIVGILSAVTIGVLSWFGVLARAKTRDMWDRRKVYTWLKANTRDEIGHSHVDTVTVAKGTRLSEERVRRACMSDRRIHRFANEPEQWSVWRPKPQSVYETRSVLRV
jgi:hypothetical protein